MLMNVSCTVFGKSDPVWLPQVRVTAAAEQLAAVQNVPPAQLGAAPQRHAPPVQLSARLRSHAAHAAPADPHAENDMPPAPAVPRQPPPPAAAPHTPPAAKHPLP